MKKILIVVPDRLDITSIKQIFKVKCSKNCVFIVEDGNGFAVNDGLLDPALDGLLEDICRSGQKIPVIHIGSEGIRIAFEEESILKVSELHESMSSALNAKEVSHEAKPGNCGENHPANHPGDPGCSRLTGCL
jgi:hypothetical protein